MTQLRITPPTEPGVTITNPRKSTMKKLLVLLLALASAPSFASNPGDVEFLRRWLDGSQGVEPIFVPEPATTALFVYDKPNRTFIFKQIGTRFDCSTAYCNVTGGTGATGMTGAAGSNGASAYEIAVANGFSGSQAAWLASLVGLPGSTGPAGANGTNGTAGATGATGATGPAGTPAPTFNFGAPAAKTVAVSTVYQAADITKAAIVTISPSCQNATSVLASSACTVQVRQSSAVGLTCSTGTVSQTWTSTVQLGLVFTQTSGSPFDVKLPIGGYFILCANAGAFTVSAVEQSAG
jgi:hypothetical protein